MPVLSHWQAPVEKHGLAESVARAWRWELVAPRERQAAMVTIWGSESGAAGDNTSALMLMLLFGMIRTR
jgi:hypothetical protein